MTQIYLKKDSSPASPVYVEYKAFNSTLELIPLARSIIRTGRSCRQIPEEMVPRMRCKPGYPEDFNDAIKRSPLMGDDLKELIKSSDSPPIFVYGHLMLPRVLKYFANMRETEKVDMVYATLPLHKLYHFSENGEAGLPTIKESSSPSDVVEGFLVFGLTAEQRNFVKENELGRLEQVVFAAVQVQVSQMDKISFYDVKCEKSVDAGTFVWNSKEIGLTPMESTFWPIDDFLEHQLYEGIVEYQRLERLQDKD